MIARTFAIAALVMTATFVLPEPSAAQGCPPGLAKKNNGCTPPGLAKKGVDREREADRVHRYGVGDRIDGDYVIIRQPREYGLDPDYTYARTGDTIYRVDNDTRQVLNIIGLISQLTR